MNNKIVKAIMILLLIMLLAIQINVYAANNIVISDSNSSQISIEGPTIRSISNKIITIIDFIIIFLGLLIIVFVSTRKELEKGKKYMIIIAIVLFLVINHILLTTTYHISTSVS